MNIHIILPLVSAVFYLLVAVFVFSKKRRDPLNISYAFLLVCVSVWNIDVAGIRLSSTVEMADLWGKVFRNGLLFIPPAFLHFILIFTHQNAMGPKPRKVLLSCYIISFVFVILNWTPYLTSGARMTKGGYHIQSGPLYIFFLAQFVISMLFSFSFLIWDFIRADSYKRQKIKYFSVALGIGTVIGSMNFLPMFGGEVYPFGTIAIMASLGVMAYAIVKHRLMDTSIFLTKGLAYILAAGIYLIPAVFLMTFLEKHYFQKSDSFFSSLIIIVLLFTAVTFNNVKQIFDKKLFQIIIRDKYLYHQILRDFSRRLVTIMDLGRLLDALGDTIKRSMGVKSLCVFLFAHEKDIFSLAIVKGEFAEKIDGITFPKDSPYAQWAEKKGEVLVRPEVENMPKSKLREELLEFLDFFPAEVCLPLIYLDHLIGFIVLGHKAEENMYLREDLDLLGSLANQVAIAIENANLYENLKKSQTIMRRADRLASLGTLIAGLAHEIRNPLVSIKTFTQLLPERIDDEEFRNYFLTVASGEIDRLTSLINELLGFAKPTEPNFQGEDVNSIIEKMGFLISTEAKKKNITINKNYTSNLPHVRADAEQIKQVLLNILLNGMQAIASEEGQIWIETRLTRIMREGGIEPFVQIEIRDNGVGISKENIDHIFDPFFTTRSEGSGLGLAITHQIVHEHGGFIDVESELGKGTSFRINFPLKSGENGGPDPR
jgi:two-component system, NtrC family, sensor kinase